MAAMGGGGGGGVRVTGGRWREPAKLTGMSPRAGDALVGSAPHRHSLDPSRAPPPPCAVELTDPTAFRHRVTRGVVKNNKKDASPAGLIGGAV